MPNKTDKTASFAQMVRASLGHGLVDGVQANRAGGRFALPLSRLAVIEADDVTPGRESVVDGVEWLAGDSDADSPILSPPGYHRDEPDKRKARFRLCLANDVDAA